MSFITSFLTLSFYTFIGSTDYLRHYGRAGTADNVTPIPTSITELPAPKRHYRNINNVSINTLSTISYPKFLLLGRIRRNGRSSLMFDCVLCDIWLDNGA